jgi:hypothetical protein
MVICLQISRTLSIAGRIECLWVQWKVYSSLSIIRMKSQTGRWAWYVVRVGVERNGFSTCGKAGRARKRPRHRQAGNIKLGPMFMLCYGLDCCGSESRPVDSCCEHVKELSVSTIYWKFLEQLHNWRLSKSSSFPLCHCDLLVDSISRWVRAFVGRLWRVLLLGCHRVTPVRTDAPL